MGRYRTERHRPTRARLRNASHELLTTQRRLARSGRGVCRSRSIERACRLAVASWQSPGTPGTEARARERGFPPFSAALRALYDGRRPRPRPRRARRLARGGAGGADARAGCRARRLRPRPRPAPAALALARQRGRRRGCGSAVGVCEGLPAVAVPAGAGYGARRGAPARPLPRRRRGSRPVLRHRRAGLGAPRRPGRLARRPREEAGRAAPPLPRPLARRWPGLHPAPRPAGLVEPAVRRGGEPAGAAAGRGGRGADGRRRRRKRRRRRRGRQARPRPRRRAARLHPAAQVGVGERGGAEAAAAPRLGRLPVRPAPSAAAAAAAAAAARRRGGRRRRRRPCAARRLRRRLFEPAGEHVLRRADVPLRRRLLQPPLPPAAQPPRGAVPHRRPRVGAARHRGRGARRVRGGVHRRDFGRRSLRAAPVGGQGRRRGEFLHDDGAALVSKNQVIDARLKGNTSRLINSSCDPNCETQRWVDGATGETRVGIFARRPVAPGDEFTYDYNFTHFGGDGAASFGCRCGAARCRGTLDAAPRRGFNPGRRLEVLWDKDTGGSEYFSATVTAYNAATGKVRLRYDDGDTDSVVLETDPIRLAAKDAVQWRFIDRPAGGDAAPAACGGHAQPEPATEGL